LKTEIDGIYVINLDWRPERWESFKHQWKLWEKSFGCTPERFPAVAGVQLTGYDEPPWFTARISSQRKKAWGGKAGAILSHRGIIELAASKSWQNVLIVEDDAILSDEDAERWVRDIKPHLSTLSDDWSAIYLFATSPASPCRLADENQGIKLVEASGALGAVAYLLNGRVLDRLLQELPDHDSIWRWVARHKTIDRWYSQNLLRFGRVYLCAPSIVGHTCVGSSDISMTAENDWQLDFALENLHYVHRKTIFDSLIFLRRIHNALRRYCSIFRYFVKRIRGL
jgi:GR25 family glycosyltransferase involved in LPS biosynthesis